MISFPEAVFVCDCLYCRISCAPSANLESDLDSLLAESYWSDPSAVAKPPFGFAVLQHGRKLVAIPWLDERDWDSERDLFVTLVGRLGGAVYEKIL